MHNLSNVLLPNWIWEKAESNEHFWQLVNNYMGRYPGYEIRKISGNFAICEIPR